jgi:hypothetical protein
MLGEGISMLDLGLLVKAARDKDLVLQVKIMDGNWEDFNAVQLKKMITSITSGNVTSSADIRMRLFAKGGGTPSQHP